MGQAGGQAGWWARWCAVRWSGGCGSAQRDLGGLRRPGDGHPVPGLDRGAGTGAGRSQAEEVLDRVVGAASVRTDRHRSIAAPAISAVRPRSVKARTRAASSPPSGSVTAAVTLAGTRSSAAITSASMSARHSLERAPRASDSNALTRSGCSLTRRPWSARTLRRARTRPSSAASRQPCADWARHAHGWRHVRSSDPSPRCVGEKACPKSSTAGTWGNPTNGGAGTHPADGSASARLGIAFRDGLGDDGLHRCSSDDTARGGDERANAAPIRVRSGCGTRPACCQPRRGGPWAGGRPPADRPLGVSATCPGRAPRRRPPGRRRGLPDRHAGRRPPGEHPALVRPGGQVAFGESAAVVLEVRAAAASAEGAVLVATHQGVEVARVPVRGEVLLGRDQTSDLVSTTPVCPGGTRR